MTAFQLEEFLDLPAVTVLGNGPTNARIMVIGEAPGVEEDRSGKPFQGAAGRKLKENLMPLAGIDPEAVRYDNVIQVHPPGNKTPTPKEIKNATPDLWERIREVSPKVVLALGATAKNALGVKPPITAVRAQPFDIDGVTVIPMYHPAAGLHNSNLVPAIISDWKRLAEVIGSVSGDTSWDTPTFYRLEDTRGALEYIEGADLVAFDLETTDNLHHGAFVPMLMRPLGYSLSNRPRLGHLCGGVAGGYQGLP